MMLEDDRKQYAKRLAELRREIQKGYDDLRAGRVRTLDLKEMVAEKRRQTEGGR